jgi:hypothetical protein
MIELEEAVGYYESIGSENRRRGREELCMSGTEKVGGAEQIRRAVNDTAHEDGGMESDGRR